MDKEILFILVMMEARIDAQSVSKRLGEREEEIAADGIVQSLML